MRLFNLLFIFLLFISGSGLAQSKFQKQFSQPDSASSLETFDAKQTPDGGYILTGLASQGSGNTYHPFLLKLDCKGDKQWTQFFGSTQTPNNIFPKVIITHDSQIVMINNIGVYSNYNGLAVRCDLSGNILWQKTLNLSTGNDIISDIKETSDGHLILTGASKSTPDVSLVKLTSDGNLIWHKTFGNNGQYDEGSTLIETNDGGYLLTGRYISMSTFNAFLLKTDSSGSMQWLRCYGDTNQHMWGFDIKQLQGGDIVMVGSTTLLKPSYSSYGDNFIMRLNSAGDTLWTKIFYGNPDLFENATSVEVDDQENFIISVATASYPTTGFVPNKHAIMKFSSSGNLLFAKTYNTGGSHYPRLNKAIDKGYILTGFSTNYSGPLGFQTLLIKVDKSLSSGCFEFDQLANTTVTSAPFKITQPVPVTGSGATITNNLATWTSTILDTTLCSHFPALHADFTVKDACINTPVLFECDSVGMVAWHWDFGDIGNADTASGSSVYYTYQSAGVHTVTLIVSNGCDQDTITHTIEISNPSAKPDLGNDKEVCLGTTIELSCSQHYPNYVWSTSDTTESITISQAGGYIVTIDDGPCGLISDTVNVAFINCDTSAISNCAPFVPNAFSPNGDNLNDVFNIRNDVSIGFEFIKMEIYNRWGNAVFSTTDINATWDGRYNGRDQNIDTYYFYIRYKCGKESRTLKGDLLLIR